MYLSHSLVNAGYLFNKLDRTLPIRFRFLYPGKGQVGEYQIDGLVQVSIANTLEILQSCTKPSKSRSMLDTKAETSHLFELSQVS